MTDRREFMAKLIAVQSELKAPRDQTNKHLRAKYRSAEGILEAVKPILKEHKLAVVLTDKAEAIDGQLFLIATVMVTDGAEELTAQHPVMVPHDMPGLSSPQIWGLASSYARKYALQGIFAIDDGNDADSNPVDLEKPVGRMEIHTLARLIEESGSDESRMCENFNVANTSQLTIGQYQQAAARMRKVIQQAKEKASAN